MNKLFWPIELSVWKLAPLIILASQLVGHAQIPVELIPLIENQLKDPARPDDASSSAVGNSNSGGSSAGGKFKIVHSQVGYSFSAGIHDFDYGSEITPPLVDLDSNPLTPEEARTYWRSEPLRPGEEIQLGGELITLIPPGSIERYYYSKHADQIFASQIGNISITWVTATADLEKNLGYTVESYVIGFGTERVTRNLFWTEVDFEAPRVQIPTGTVQDLVILYNEKFPEKVAPEDRLVPSGVDEELIPERTVWYDRNLKMLRAYNLNGRVLIEYLGAPRGDNPDKGLRQHLGIEVIEVQRVLSPVTVASVIGEQLLPARTPANLLNDADYTPVQISAPGPPVAQHFIDNRTVYFGIGENLQAPLVEFYWLQEGEHTILWPELRNDYLIEWPEEVGDFEGVFARPELESDDDLVKSTYLNLFATNTPELVFQDDPKGNEASLDFQFHLFVDLEEDEVNRSLIRLNNGIDFWYVRLYSATTSHLREIDISGGEFDPEIPLDPLDFHIEENVVVGQRLQPPKGLAPGGYVDPDLGNAYQVDAYIDPFEEGGILAANMGAIIPVNALPNNNTLRVWWFRELAPPADKINLFKPLFIPAVQGDYTITYPVNAPAIVMASNAGTGDLTTEKANGRIYFQNDPSAPGYNPNEEHAMMISGRGYALRDDINIPDVTSDPYVLISYDDADDRPDMTVFKVLREDETHIFKYAAIAGKQIQGPLPLPLIPQPIQNGVSRNIEVTPGGQDPVVNGEAAENLTHYDKFTFQDRKGNTWAYRGPHNPKTVEPGAEPTLEMQYYYPTLAGFAFPDDTGSDNAPAIGTIVPYISNGDPITGEPIRIVFTPEWPEESPLLQYGETLAKPKFGLPQILGQSSVQLVYQQSIALDFDTAQNSVVLHDSTINRTAHLADHNIEVLPSSVATTSSSGRLYFQELPSHLQDRVFFDDSVGTRGALVFQGRFHDEFAGEDYLLLNTLSPDDVVIMKDLCDSNDPAKTDWNTLVDNLGVTPIYRALDDRFNEIALTYDEWLEREGIEMVLGQSIQPTYGPTELPQVADPDQAVDGYYLSAIGGGSGYVTIVTGNGLLNTDPGEPVQMHILRVGEELYQGELKPLVASNPLSEKVTVQHTGDFAARPDDYEFEWRKAPPVNGLHPDVFLFKYQNIAGGLTDTEIYRNEGETPGTVDWVFQGPTTMPINDSIYRSGDDRSVPGMRVTGTLDFSSHITGNDELNKVYLSLNLDEGDGAIVKVNDEEIIRYHALNGMDSEVASGIPSEIKVFLTNNGSYVVFELPGRIFDSAGPNEIEILLSTMKADDVATTFNLRAAIQTREDRTDANYLPASPVEAGKNRFIVSGSGIDTLGDNYFIMRYRPTTGHPLDGQWSEWTEPALVEGWIKRVLAGINPFNQRLSDFFENAVDTNVSIISQAGSRWEGDVALTLDAVQDTGLIAIYETVLKRGINLSIDGTPAVDYAPANDALLLAAGYLSDLYIALGNEAFADALNPTVSFDGQALGTLGDAAITAGFEENFRSTATSRFAFQGQVATLLDEELSLLRGRDDFLSPSIETAPVYNRLFWNYTRGIDAGELIYALNYNIREQNDAVADGKIDAEDAARMFPQAHGDAYGHYLTAVKNYYRLLTDPQFTWGTRIEAVNVLGQPVSVDYFDERKFASGAAALTRTADQIVSLERRKAFQEAGDGWENLRDGRENDRTGTIRHWGVDDWAARGGQGAYFHWTVGNAILPDEDLVNEGIQKIDRSSVPELDAIAKAAENIQRQMEAADARVNPLDLSNDSLLFDISPSNLAEGETHFEQIYQRATTALNNANAVFERAGDSTRLLRSLENQSVNLTQVVDDEETAYIAELIDIFGQPYPGDIGPGKIYPQGYTGPDLVRYQTIARPFEIFTKDYLFGYEEGKTTFTLNIFDEGLIDSINGKNLTTLLDVEEEFEERNPTVSFTLSEDSGPYQIADPTLGRRPGLGTLQTTLNEVRLAEEQLYAALAGMNLDRVNLTIALDNLDAGMRERLSLRVANNIFSNVKFLYKEVLVAIETLDNALKLTELTRKDIVDASVKSLPTVVGFSNDVSAPARAAILAADIAAGAPLTATAIFNQQADAVADLIFILGEKTLEIETLVFEDRAYVREQITKIKDLYAISRGSTRAVDALNIAYLRAIENYRTELAKGQTVLTNRGVFRRRAASAIQGYRTRDIAFRTFRTEALEEYQTLLNWASRYAFLAAQAYDYETGLLGSPRGQAFLGDIISSRALGVLGEDGQPMHSASANGDPGLSGLLAKLKGDYDAVKGRLGFNNPETNGTTFSLRREFFRIPDTPDGDVAWRQALEGLVTTNLLNDADIATHAMQLGGDGLSLQAGFLISMRTVIEEGKNFFGKDLLPGDSAYTPSHFATKISSLGVVLEGYQGMAPCHICANGPGDPTHNHDDALSATPYVYLIPAGVDTMRTPPLGDGQALRQWSVRDYAMPMPFDIGGLEPTNEAVEQVSDNLRINFRSARRHPAFRATDIPDYFYTTLAEDYTSSRLVGRSVWNSNWKLAIPAKGLLADESEGISRFIRSVKDIKLHLKTYSYAGN